MKKIASIIFCLVLILSLATSSKAIPIADKTDIQKQIDENIRKLEEYDITPEEAEKSYNRVKDAEEKIYEYEKIWKEKYPITEENVHNYLCSLREWLFDYDVPGVESYYVHDDYLFVNFAEDDIGYDFIYQPELSGISI